LTPGPAGADSTVAGPPGPAGLGAVAFDSAPTAADDMNTYTLGTIWIDTSAATAYILVDNSLSAAVWTALGSPTISAIGDTGPAGGIVFHITDRGLHGLEVATVDQASAHWGCNGTTLPGANGTAVGTGKQNTADIILFCNETTATSVAAAYGDGWYLPSEDQLNLLYSQKVTGVVGGLILTTTGVRHRAIVAPRGAWPLAVAPRSSTIRSSARLECVLFGTFNYLSL
jgi:hypothetical protein